MPYNEPPGVYEMLCRTLATLEIEAQRARELQARLLELTAEVRWCIEREQANRFPEQLPRFGRVQEPSA